jgi:CRISPR type I-E-associated protein CasB/Cse2
MSDQLSAEEIGTRARAWWARLRDIPGAASTLRRCRTTAEAVMNPQTLSLIRRLQAGTSGRAERIAALAIVLAHITQDSDRTLMRIAGNSRFEADDAKIAETRALQLFAARDPDDLIASLTRIITHMGGTASVSDLATSLYWWTDRTRAGWARDYYAANVITTQGDAA